MYPFNKIPGEVGWPVTGDKTIEFARNPISFVESRIKKYNSKIFIARVLNRPTVFVASNKGVKDILIDRSSSFNLGYKDFGYMHALFGDLLIFDDDEDAYRLRKLLKEFFHAAHCGDYMEMISRITKQCLTDLHLKSAVDVYEVFKDMLTNICLSLFLGIEENEYESLKESAKLHWHGLISVPLNLKVKGWSSSYSKAEEAKNILLAKIKEKLHSNKTNSRFLQLVNDAGFRSEDEACSHLLLFISSIIPKALSSLLTSFVLETAGDFKEHLREKACDNEEYLDNILLEVQRLFPPLYGGRRYTNEEVVIDGYTVPKDHSVAYLTKYANRDSKVFDEADIFIPDRWTEENSEKRHLIWTFGGGTRSCIGIHFINSLLKMVGIHLLTNFNWDITSEDVPVYKTLPVARPKEAVQVTFYPKSQDGLITY